MNEYKRLTNKNLDEFNPEYDFCIGCEYFGEPNGCNRQSGSCGNYDQFNEMYNRLAELEDKIENGTYAEVVRCKDCFYSHFNTSTERYTCQREYPRRSVEEDDFCNYGKRRKEDGQRKTD